MQAKRTNLRGYSNSLAFIDRGKFVDIETRHQQSQKYIVFKEQVKEDAYKRLKNEQAEFWDLK